MNSTVSPEDADQALREIETSRAAMRRAIRAHRQSSSQQLGLSLDRDGACGPLLRRTRYAVFPWFIVPGVLASNAIGFYQARQIRVPIDKRFLAALACLVVFGLLWPAIFGVYQRPSDGIRIFAFFSARADLCSPAFGSVAKKRMLNSRTSPSATALSPRSTAFRSRSSAANFLDCWDRTARGRAR